jgi:hypothetical protein
MPNRGCRLGATHRTHLCSVVPWYAIRNSNAGLKPSDDGKQIRSGPHLQSLTPYERPNHASTRQPHLGGAASASGHKPRLRSELRSSSHPRRCCSSRIGAVVPAGLGATARNAARNVHGNAY